MHGFAYCSSSPLLPQPSFDHYVDSINDSAAPDVEPTRFFVGAIYRRPKRYPLAKNKHTYAKRQREMEKRRKAEQKRLKKHKTPQPSDTDQLTG